MSAADRTAPEPSESPGRPLPPRPADGHKGTFGTVVVLGGSVAGGRVMLGAPCLAARAALRAGAGLVVLAVPEPLATAAIGIVPEATALALPVDEEGSLRPADAAAVLDAHAPRPECLVAGPGLGGGAAVQQVLVRLLARDDVPVVLDADGLNAIAALPGFDRDLRSPAILTPHPGEFDRLARGLALDLDARDPARRRDAAATLAGRLGGVVVLKGRHTVVADGLGTWTSATGGPSLATGGTGDVLAGLIGGLVAQHVRLPAAPGLPADPAGRGLAEIARLAVHAHGLAADRWAAVHGGAARAAGRLAGELADALPAVLAELRTPAADEPGAASGTDDAAGPADDARESGGD